MKRLCMSWDGNFNSLILVNLPNKHLFYKILSPQTKMGDNVIQSKKYVCRQMNKVKQPKLYQYVYVIRLFFWKDFFIFYFIMCVHMYTSCIVSHRLLCCNITSSSKEKFFITVLVLGDLHILQLSLLNF